MFIVQRPVGLSKQLKQIIQTEHNMTIKVQQFSSVQFII